MSLRTYNLAEITILKGVRDEIKYHLGVELGHDPRDTVDGLVEVEMRFSDWLTIGGGGAWLRTLPQIKKEM